MAKVSMDKLVALSKNRGFVYAGSEIYGGLANTWDYGPLGVELKNNIKKAWWKFFVQNDPNNFGLDSAILMNPTTWEASGHIGGFSDPLMDCKNCKTRHRADNLIEDYNARKGISMQIAGLDNNALEEYIASKKIPCPNCGKCEFTSIRKFNLMFKTFQGVNEDTASTVYLRPETAQGIFVNFKNLLRFNRGKLPFGVGQIGKSFRNEITPGNFIFRVREFEQMELEFFCKPDTDMEWFNHYKAACKEFLLSIGLKEESLRTRDHSAEELSHYSKATTDFEFLFPFGWGELWGIANRTNYDLKCHMERSGQNLEFNDLVTGERFIPYVIEPSLGVERTFLAVLSDAYNEEVLEGGDIRTVLHLAPHLAPYKVAVLPLQKNKLGEKSEEVYKMLCNHFVTAYDETTAIGKRYRRQDEIGTPLCVTIDFDTLTDNMVTVRNRDTMKQDRVSIDKLVEYINGKINN